MNKKDSNGSFPVRILAATFLPHLSASLAQGSIGVLAPFIQKAMEISRTQIGALTSAQSAGWITMALAGSMVERSGIRAWIALCPLVTGLCTLIFAKTSSYNSGLAIMVVLGLAYSTINLATTKAIVIGFPRQRRGTAIAIKQTGIPAGIFLGSVSLPAIAVLSGWQAGMVVVGAVNIAAGVCCWLLYSEKAASTGADDSKPRGSLKKDMVDLLRNSDFLLVSFLQGIYNIGQYSIQSYLVLYLVESAGYSSIHAGFVAAVTQFCGVLGRVVWGVVSDFAFAGRRVPVLQVIGLTSVAGLFGLAFITGATPAWIVLVVASIAGTGTLGFTGTSILLRAELAGKDLAATATGMGMAIASWGVILGPPLFGLIVDNTNSYKLAWEIVGGITLAATFTLRSVREGRPPAGAVGGGR